MICELHMKETGFLLGEITFRWQRIRDTLYEMNYTGDGWMQIEGAMPKDAAVVDAYKHNLYFLQTLFNKASRNFYVEQTDALTNDCLSVCTACLQSSGTKRNEHPQN